ncbi:MAG: transglycosylase SLT domain-containing protein [Candidatus Krumholzibacteria bacterium]|nr:transglycosylase SLT domain-containing protein [Candidatus Krumholzibacteria bacterium]
MDLPATPIALTPLTLEQARLTSAGRAAVGAQTEAGAAEGNDLEGLRSAAGQFEALFYGQLIRAMRATVPDNSFWGQDGGAKIYQQLHDQALADRMAAGGGLGIADLIVRQFQGAVASETGSTSAPSARPPDRPADPRGLTVYRRQVAASEPAAQLARLREQATQVGGAVADSLRRWQHELTAAAASADLEPALVLAVMVQESGGDAAAVSRRGAQGLMQLMPETARELGVTDPLDPRQNLQGGARYLASLLRRYEGDLDLALAAYNAGPGTVDRLGRRVPDYRETTRYVAAVKDLAARLGARTGTNLDEQRPEDPKLLR